MLKVIIRCSTHNNPVTYHVREATAYLGYICAECAATVLIDVEPGPPLNLAGQPKEGAP